MSPDEKRALIDRYLAAYNTFDIDGMLAEIHPAIEFRNITDGEVNAAASGIDEFRRLAEQSNSLFASRAQTLQSFAAAGDAASIAVEFVAVLAADLPNGMRKGATIRLAGRTEFEFRDGRICRITDSS